MVPPLSMMPEFVNVVSIAIVPVFEINPELLTGLEIVTMWPINLSSASPGTPGLPSESSQVSSESHDPLVTVVNGPKVSGGNPSKICTMPPS